jgi:hypothetical protein
VVLATITTILCLYPVLYDLLRKPVLVNVHTVGGIGNAMCNLATAYHNRAATTFRLSC